jgi:UDP-2-acetamido-3-amino-2,3-dideoxy-glucuronate N-acetyltransferase
VVSRRVPDFALVMGVPGRVVGYVCACGVRLELKPEDAAQATVCAACAEAYVWDGVALRADSTSTSGSNPATD